MYYNPIALLLQTLCMRINITPIHPYISSLVKEFTEITLQVLFLLLKSHFCILQIKYGKTSNISTVKQKDLIT